MDERASIPLVESLRLPMSSFHLARPVWRELHLYCSERLVNAPSQIAASIESAAILNDQIGFLQNSHIVLGSALC